MFIIFNFPTSLRCSNFYNQILKITKISNYMMKTNRIYALYILFTKFEICRLSVLSRVFLYKKKNMRYFFKKSQNLLNCLQHFRLVAVVQKETYIDIGTLILNYILDIFGVYTHTQSNNFSHNSLSIVLISSTECLQGCEQYSILTSVK